LLSEGLVPDVLNSGALDANLVRLITSGALNDVIATGALDDILTRLVGEGLLDEAFLPDEPATPGAGPQPPARPGKGTGSGNGQPGANPGADGAPAAVDGDAPPVLTVLPGLVDVWRTEGVGGVVAELAATGIGTAVLAALSLLSLAGGTALVRGTRRRRALKRR
jgi:hypothetical protein